ncbi:hypothetical protein NDU88_004950 [Pleurodeles waltl]|uniref:Uncharacterized protein n=1 Tax=Pleurodeles waltl TaxID=8319 RepID=A0AAV7PJ14_PLEWA|nr:hypothetical protein NDU88_004950 [Pleurodeles waltl]
MRGCLAAQRPTESNNAVRYGGVLLEEICGRDWGQERPSGLEVGRDWPQSRDSGWDSEQWWEASSDSLLDRTTLERLGRTRANLCRPFPEGTESALGILAVDCVLGSGSLSSTILSGVSTRAESVAPNLQRQLIDEMGCNKSKPPRVEDYAQTCSSPSRTRLPPHLLTVFTP